MADNELTPPGFEPLRRSSPFTELVGPVYVKGRGKDMVLGLRIAEKHANARGFTHGGVLMTLADVALGYAMAFSQEPPVALATASMTTDFADAARIGDWVEVHTDIQRIGTTLAFANAYLSVEGRRIARASGVFAVSKARLEGGRPAE
jgi:uncharacterized protein (TIGR00369 family)